MEDPSVEVLLKEAWLHSSSYSVNFMTERRGLLSFKCKWEYGLNPQRDGLRNGSRMPCRFLTCLYFQARLQEKTSLSVVIGWNIWSTSSCVWCIVIKAERCLTEQKREEKNRVTLQVKLWVIIFLFKEANCVELCVFISVLQMLTSHKAIKEVLMWPKLDLFWVITSCTLHTSPQKMWCKISISPLITL